MPSSASAPATPRYVRSRQLFSFVEIKHALSRLRGQLVHAVAVACWRFETEYFSSGRCRHVALLRDSHPGQSSIRSAHEISRIPN